jgi:hypothetical protein
MKRENGYLNVHFGHFHMNRAGCIRLAQMLYDDGKNVEELEDLFGGKVKEVVDGELQWENWGRMIRRDD